MNIPFLSAEAMKDYAVRTKVFILSLFLLAVLLLVANAGVTASDDGLGCSSSLRSASIRTIRRSSRSTICITTTSCPHSI